MIKRFYKCEYCPRGQTTIKGHVQHKINFHPYQISRALLEGYGNEKFLDQYDRAIEMG